MTTPAAAKFAYSIVWVKDVSAAVSFYRDAFGLNAKRVQDMPGFTWAEIDTGATTLAFAGESEIRTFFPGGFAGHAAGAPPLAQCLSFAVPDVQAAWDKALAHGATGLRTPVKQPWGQTWAQLRDPNGVLISLVA